jgi:hypothetical protein
MMNSVQVNLKKNPVACATNRPEVYRVDPFIFFERDPDVSSYVFAHIFKLNFIRTLTVGGGGDWAVGKDVVRHYENLMTIWDGKRKTYRS